MEMRERIEIANLLDQIAQILRRGPEEKEKEVVEEKEISLSDLQEAGRQFLRVGKRDDLALILQHFNCPNISSVPKEKYREVLEKLNAVNT